MVSIQRDQLYHQRQITSVVKHEMQAGFMSYNQWYTFEKQEYRVVYNSQ